MVDHRLFQPNAIPVATNELQDLPKPADPTARDGGTRSRGHLGATRFRSNLLIQIRGGDILWQKERLLSIALAAVPASCDKIVWIDCDVIFEPADPWQQVCEKLDHEVLVQPFKDALDLPFGWEGGSLAESRAARDCSVGYAVATGASSTRVLTPDLSDGHRPRWRAGLAVAFRREVFERHDFYFGRVLGGNDRAILCAALGQYEVLAYVHHLTARQQEHFCEWAKPFFGTARGRLGYADATIGHLWHGSIKNRNYGGDDTRIFGISNSIRIQISRLRTTAAYDGIRISRDCTAWR